MTSSDDVFITKLQALIDANMDDPTFSVDTICRDMGISRAQLHRIVKEQVDLSVTLYIRKIRLEKANYLLTNTNLRISEVADQVGISNPQNFSKYFTLEFSISPTEFRRRLQRAFPPTELPTPETFSPVAAPLPSVLAIPEAAPVEPTTPAVPQRLLHPTPRWMLYSAVLAALVLGLSLYLRTYRQSVTQLSDSNTTSIAVLPFVNMGPSDTDPISEGLMDDIHTALSLIGHLRVTARSSSDQYRNSKKDISQISEDLGVNTILRAKMLKSGEQIQLKVELINAKDDQLIWAKTYSKPFRDVFQLTGLITQDVARELDLENNPTSVDKLGLVRTNNMVAYNDFLQGRQLVVSRKKENILAGLAKFDQALALDSTFAEVYAFKGVAYSVLANSDYTTDPTNMYTLAQQHALKAIQIDPTNSTAYGVLGTIYADTYQWQAAETSFRIALQHNSNDAQINYWYSLLLRSTGQLTEAIRYSTQAIALDPLYPVILSGHIVTCAYANRFDLAQASLANGRALFGDSFIFQLALGHLQLCQNDYEAATADITKALAMNPQFTGQIPVLMHCEAKRGNRAKALRYIQTLTDTNSQTYYYKAVVFAGLNQRDSCLYNLKKAANLGYIHKDMAVSPLFRHYRSEPVFQGVLRQYRFP